MKKFYLLFFILTLVVFGGNSQSLPYVNQTEMGLLLGKVNEQDKRINFSVQSFNGVRAHPHHEVGFLIGWDSYPHFSLMPVALGWRGFRDKGRKLSTYASMDIGYASAWTEKRFRENQWESWYQGGLIFSPAIGLRKKSTNRRHAFSWSLGFKRQKASFFEGRKAQGLILDSSHKKLPPGFLSIREEDYIFNSLFLKWGIVF